MADPFQTAGDIRIRILRKPTGLEVTIEHDAYQRKEWTWSARRAEIVIDPVLGEPFSMSVTPGDPGVQLRTIHLASVATRREETESRLYPDQFMVSKTQRDDLAAASFGPRPSARTPPAPPPVAQDAPLMPSEPRKTRPRPPVRRAPNV